MFSALTKKFASSQRALFMHKVNGKYTGISYSAAREKVRACANGFASLGIAKGDRVSIISENRPEWAITDLAVVSLGAIDVPIYPTLTAKQTEFILNDAGVCAVIVSNQYQLNKVQKIAGNVSSLKHIIIMNDKPTDTPDVLSLHEVFARGGDFQAKNPQYVDDAIAMVRPDSLLTFIYTSGTTGNPKGVMLSHDNIVSNMINAARVIQIKEGFRMLSFLPLSHSFERMAGYYTSIACGGTIAYAESIETVRDNMLEVQPDVVMTVPRLFERIHSRILKQVESGSTLKKKIFYWGIGVGHEFQNARKRGEKSSILAMKNKVADKLVFSKVRERTGGRLQFFVSGGAALPREFGEFFEALGLTIIEGYGLTETSPVLTVNPREAYKFGSVGKTIPGVELKIAADGEILARGPNIMQGYWNNPEATAEVIDKDGWFHTGDIGVIDSDGYVYITDRKKHLFVSSGGKNIAPQPIENLFLGSRFIEQFVLIGDRRMFLTALIVPDFDVLKEYADSHKISYTSYSELVGASEIHQLIDRDIQTLQKDLSTYERVRKFRLLEKPLTIEDGELTPTLKVRRKVVEERYSALIEGMYEGIS